MNTHHKHPDTIENWLDTDERMEALNALKFVEELLVRVEQEPYFWKWVVITVHYTIQAYMVLAIWGGDHRRIMSHRYLGHFRRTHGGSDVAAWHEKYHLASFIELYSRIKEGKRSQGDDSTEQARWLDPNINKGPFSPTEEVGRSVRELDELRNDFIHFSPKMVTYNLRHVALKVHNSLSVISFLTVNAHALAYLGGEVEEQTLELLERITPRLEQLIEAYSSPDTESG